MRGFGNLALAVSDVFGVKAALTVLGKVGVKSAVKTGASAAGRALGRQALKPLASNAGKVLVGRGISRIPAFVKDARTLGSYLKNVDEAAGAGKALSRGETAELLNRARRYGMKITKDAGHAPRPGMRKIWENPHYHIGKQRFHLPCPPK